MIGWDLGMGEDGLFRARILGASCRVSVDWKLS
jgi:hypothetical protein